MGDQTKSFYLVPAKELNQVEKCQTNTNSKLMMDENKVLLDLFSKLKNLERVSTKSNQLINKSQVSDLNNYLKESEIVDNRFKKIINSENLPDSTKLHLYSTFKNMENKNTFNPLNLIQTDKETQTANASTNSNKSIPILNVHKLSKASQNMAMDLLQEMETDGHIEINDGVIYFDKFSINLEDF